MAMVVLEEMMCPNCGVVFAMPETLVAAKRRNQTPFYCINGHSLNFAAATVGDVRDGKASFDKPKLVVDNQP